RPMAAAHRGCHVGAARRRAVLRELRPLLLSHLAAHAAGRGGVGARRRARSPAPALSYAHAAHRQASRPACARARPAAHGGDGGAVIELVPRERRMRAKLRSSLPGLTRQSIHLRKMFSRRRWMRGSSPRMTRRENTYGLRPISMAMTLGRCSMRGPAEAETPAMMPSAISAAASACATGASSLAPLPAADT